MAKNRWIAELQDKISLQGRIIIAKRNNFNELATQWSGTEHTPEGREINFSTMVEGNSAPIRTAAMDIFDALIGKDVKPTPNKPQYNAAPTPQGEQPVMDSTQYVDALIASHMQR